MEQTKSFNNRGGKNRLRFSSSKSRAKSASADIYRAHIGSRLPASSTAVREKRVHDGSDRKAKKFKGDVAVRFFERENDAEGFGIGRSAVIVAKKEEDETKEHLRNDDDDDGTEDEEEKAQIFLTGGTEFLTEIEISGQRNGSQIFHKLISELRHLSKSFAELLHHKEKIVNLMCASLLTAEDGTGGHLANAATNDVLHLFGVLARELRDELYPFLNDIIFPRIINDMLNPPLLTSSPEGQPQQRIPLDVTHVEAAFRCLSYLFKYNSEELISGQDAKVSDADMLRQHYGKTICHRRDIVRKLACEAYAPLLRKCSDRGLKKHLMRTVKALATSLVNAEQDAGVTENNISNSMKRARMDAIDGVSTLLFEVARGAKRVHSKTGKVVIRALMDCLIGYNNHKRDDVKILKAENSKVQVVYEVASQCLYKLRGHIVKGTPLEESIDPSVFGGVFDEIFTALDTATAVVKDSESISVVNTGVIGHIIDLVSEMIDFQDGRLIRDASDKKTESDRITKSIQYLLKDEVYSNADKKLECQILRLMCSTWRTNPDHPYFSLRLGKFFPRIVTPAATGTDCDRSPAIYLAKNLLPFLSQKVASEALIPSLLSAAASPIGKHQGICDESLILLHTVATCSWPSDEYNECEVDPDDAAADSFFSTKVAEQLPVISSKVRTALVELCLRDNLKIETSKSTYSTEQLAHIGYVARCLPFLVCLCCSNDESDDETLQTDVTHMELTKVLKWYASTTSHLISQCNDAEDTHIILALLVESFSVVAIQCRNRVNSSKIQTTLRKSLSKIKAHANSLLFAHPKSLWVIKSVAAFTNSLRAIDPGSYFNDKANETFELLVPALAQSDHFIRLYTLKILESYPKRPFVTDHADLDLTDDLEEGPSATADVNNAVVSETGKSELTGSCDIISLMRTLESIPIAFANERKLTSQISRVEVYANTGKLPLLYADATVCHMLGLLHVKFAPIWPAAVRVIVALTSSYETSTWTYLYAALQRSLEKSAPKIHLGTPTPARDRPANAAIHDEYRRCVEWESSESATDLFTSAAKVDRETVSRNARADELTFFENLWSILASAPNLTITKSKLVVPLFFEFMIDQYYVFHSDDPDMREINLSQIVDSNVKWNREELGRRSLHRKFEAFLKVFASVKGPQQLYKHQLLLQMFIGFLSNPDPKLASLSLTCVQRYKLQYLMPYLDSVQSMLKKDELRDALAKFDLSVDSDSVDADHRDKLIPIVTRILFGRLSSKGTKSKSARDSPAARRAAILSFFSRMGNVNGELTHFIYMMVRVFIPSEQSTQFQFDTSITSLMTISSKDIEKVPVQRQVGFLNLLYDVISQIGFGILHAVPVLAHILLTIAEEAHKQIQAPTVDTDSGDEEISGSQYDAESSQAGRLRTLTFLRLGDLFTKFASSAVDFSTFGQRMWEVTSCSLLALPNTVINAENPPSLLRLIEKISEQPKLIHLIGQSYDVIPSVFRCIAGTTRFKVMGSVLHIVDNLLNAQDVGETLILEHIHLLISQFNERLTSKITQSETIDDKRDGQRFNATERLQLDILCRVSELLLNDESTEQEHIQTMESLCGLLVPLLNFSAHQNQVNLMRIVANLMPRLSAKSAKQHYHALSKLLGPNKANPGITLSVTRQTLISALCGIGKSSDLGPITEAVRELNAFSKSHIDEYDFDIMLPVLNKLGSAGSSQGSWLNLSVQDNDDRENPQTLFPLLYSCLHMLYSPDAVIGRAANKAIKALITTCSEQIHAQHQTTDLSHNKWMQFVEKTVIPCIRVGLTTKTDDNRRHFVLLIAHVARSFRNFQSSHLYGDLNSLIRDDDQDLDFFLNVTHLQIHRRVKGLQRLRKMITTVDKPIFSEQSLGNVLLPLALHPVYERSSKTEDALALEAIATVGAISGHLHWGKYHEALQSVLNSLTRHPENERHLIALLCAIIDSFHFTVEPETTESESENGSCKKIEGNGIWRSLKNRIIPKVETFLLKDKTHDRGSKSKTIRPPVVLALVKLCQKLPTHIFEAKLPQLIKVISTTLKNKDSNDRDVARETMAKIASSVDIKYLPILISDISVTLSSGYQLHVRAATLHSILVAIASVYVQPTVYSADEANSALFDRCVPAMLDLIQQDIFGTACEMKEAENVEKRLIKEAMGSKSLDSLEIISKLVLFKPSVATSDEKRINSSAHVIVAPFIERLLDPEVSPATIRKVKECLAKVVTGLSNNFSADIKEVLPFIYATVAPFVLGEMKKLPNVDGELDDSDEEADALQVTKTNGAPSALLEKKKAKGTVVAVSTWAPSTLDALENQRSALEFKRVQKRNLHKVTDGAAAPKLTGRSRHNPMKSTAKLLNNPANASALIFGLSLLNSCLKRFKLDASDEIICSMSDPYLHLLLRYVQFSRDSNGIVLALRCLASLLRVNLPSVSMIANELSPVVLEHLTAWGAASNTQADIVQGCFKTLHLLFLHPNLSSSEQKASNLPLTTHQMQALISLLQSAVMESEHHNATFGLIKAICTKKYISPEFYDLMDIILKLSVQSQKPSVRMQSSQIFLQYLLDYPMGAQRLDNHLQQIVLNIKYEYEEGRLSAMELLFSAIQKLPIPVLEKNSQLFFLPLVLQLANDVSKSCKEAVTKNISLLLSRLSIDIVQSFFGYVDRWSKSPGDTGLAMRQAAAQLCGIFVESRPDFIQRGTTAADMICSISNTMRDFIPFDSDDGWELLYYNVLCIEKMNKDFSPAILSHDDLGVSLIKLMAYPHPWVMQASLRIINKHVGSVDPKKFTEQTGSYLVKSDGCLYDLARNLCRQLDVDDAHFVEALSVLAIKTITWLFQVMNHQPALFYNTGGDLEGGESTEHVKNPCNWIMSRLSSIAKPKHGTKRRESIFKCYAALCASCKPEQLTPYLRLMITSLDRAIREETNNLRSEEQQSSLIAFPKDVLNLLEDVCGTEKFLEAYGEVNKTVREKKNQRKQDIAAEAVHNPTIAAKRQIKKQLHEKERKKRRMHEMKLMRGTSKTRKSAKH